MRAALLSLLWATVKAQLAFSQNVHNSYLPPSLSEQPTEQKRTIYFEEDYLLSRATEPGVCDVICAASDRVEVARKPGVCPPPTAGPHTADFKHECKYDSECPMTERCCDGGGGGTRQCMVPDGQVKCDSMSCQPGTNCVEYSFKDATCVDPTPKADECPHMMANSMTIGGCDDMCRFDSECDGDAKCCSNGCARRCLRPGATSCDTFACKPGYECFEEAAGQPACRHIPCSQDGKVVDIDCNSCTCTQGVLLCSQEVCPPVKPGFCPRIVKGYKGICAEDCTVDSNCPGAQRCCSTGCGDTCQKPIKVITHPCQTVRFRCGEKTQCAATRGLCQPGDPCPLTPICVGSEVPYCESCPPGKVCVLQKRSCRGAGVCHSQPICIQPYSDDTLFEESEDVEIATVDKTFGVHFDAALFN